MAQVRTGHLEQPTPYAEWNVRDLINHTIGVMQGVSGQSCPDGDVADYTAGDGAKDAFDRAAAASLGAWGADRVFDGPGDIGAGAMRAEVAFGINVLDTLTHAWDLDEAFGLARSMDPVIAGAALATSKMIVSDDLRAGRFGPEVPIADDAPVHDQLAAFLGRTPT